jgi:hypothetical protein
MPFEPELSMLKDSRDAAERELKKASLALRSLEFLKGYEERGRFEKYIRQIVRVEVATMMISMMEGEDK